MASDPFDGLLDLEDNFYKEGYDAGIADGELAGRVEGKTFGIEKGYEKALELAKLHGRAIVWQMRSQQDVTGALAISGRDLASRQQTAPLIEGLGDSKLPKNARLTKHIDGLLSASDHCGMKTDNSDEAVTEFDDRISRAQAKAKVIAAIVGESLNTDMSTNTATVIEDSKGLNARH